MKKVSVIKQFRTLKTLKAVHALAEKVNQGLFPCSTGKHARRRARAYSEAIARITAANRTKRKKMA